MAKKKDTIANGVISDMTTAQPAVAIQDPLSMTPDQMDAAKSLEDANKNLPDLTGKAVQINDTIAKPSAPAQQQINEDIAPVIQNDRPALGVEENALPKAAPIMGQKEMDDTRNENKVLAEMTPEEKVQYNAVIDAGNQSVRAMIDQWEEDKRIFEEEQRIAEEEAKEYRQRAVWGGATEAAAAIVNLIGTANGATSQQYQLQTGSWMKEAETQRQMRRNRLDAIRRQQQASQREMTEAKAKAGLNKASMLNTLSKQRVAEQRQDLAQERQAVTNAYTVARTEGEYLNQELKVAQQALKEAKSEAEIKKINAQINEINSRIRTNNARRDKLYNDIQNSKIGSNATSAVSSNAASANSLSIDDEFLK